MPTSLPVMPRSFRQDVRAHVLDQRCPFGADWSSSPCRLYREGRDGGRPALSPLSPRTERREEERSLLVLGRSLDERLAANSAAEGDVAFRLGGGGSFFLVL